MKKLVVLLYISNEQTENRINKSTSFYNRIWKNKMLREIFNQRYISFTDAKMENIVERS